MARDVTARVVRNLFELRRVENALGRDLVRPFLRDLFDDLAAAIARRDPTSVARPDARRARLERLLSELAAIITEAFPALRKTVRVELARLGVAEAMWSRRSLELATEGAVGVAIGHEGVGLNFFKAVLDREPLESATLQQWFDGLAAGTRRRVSREITRGVVQSETLDEIVRRVRGRSDGRGGFTGGVMRTTTRDAETIVRTAVNDIANRAHEETFRQNADIIARVRYVATLDTRTSDICISLDGREWKPDDPKLRRPPQHPNCRSVLVPVIDYRAAGIPQPVEGRRAAKDGPVPSSTVYEDWLRDQPASVQDEIIGPARAKLFRAGKLDLRQLVKSDGRSRTVDELMELSR